MKSSMRLVLISAVLLMAAMIMAPVAALGSGDTIFVYEEGLDLTELRYSADEPITALVKYVDDADPYGTEAKAQINSIPVGNDASFDVLDSQVGNDYGLYYVVVGADPGVAGKTVNIRMPDVTLGVTLADSGHSDSIDGKSISKTTEMAFKLSTRYVAVESERLSAGVDIEVTTPGGAKTTGFGDATFKNVTLDSSRFWTDDLSSEQVIDLSDVEAGTYSAQAKWAYPAGFSDYADDSNTVTFTVSTKKIAIESNKDNVVRGNNFVVTITGDSKTPYWVYVKDASVADNKYPVILKGQSGVHIVNDADDNDAPTMKNATDIIGTSEYPIDESIAKVTTKADGTRPVEFVTNATTDDSTFTIKVIENLVNGKYDTVKVKVEKGAVTVTASGDQSYFLGEEITLSGTNTDSDDIYLFIKGSNLYDNGASLIDGTKVVSDDEDTFVVESVETDDTWEYKWDTSEVNLDAGTYTIYAVSQPKDKSDISDAEYGTISVSIKEAFVTAEASSKTVAKGDSLYVRGTAEGSPSEGVKIWVLGRNYFGPDTADDFGAPATQSVEDDGSYEYEFDNTEGLSSGQYFVVVQHPMKNGFGIATEENDNSVNVINKVSDDKIEFVIDGKESLQGSNAAEALINALNSPYIDDTYVKLSFMIEEAIVTIDPIGEHAVGDTFTITGKTNLAVGDDLSIDVTSSSFKPTEKTQTTGVGGTSGTVPVVAGDDENTWSFEVITTSFQPDDYIVKVESIEADTITNAGFSLVKATPTTEPTEPVVEPTETTVPTETATAVPTETATPGFGAILALIGLGAVAVLVLRKD